MNLNSRTQVTDDLRSLNLFAWMAVAFWMTPIIQITVYYVPALGFLWLVPLPILVLSMARMLYEPLFNYNAHTPPFEGEDTSHRIPTWAVIALVSGFLAFLYALSVFNPEGLEQMTQMFSEQTREQGSKFGESELV